VCYGCCEKKKEKRNLFLSLFEKNEMFMMNVNIHHHHHHQKNNH